MKIDIPKFLLFVMMTTAAAVAADSSSSSTLATKLAIEEEKPVLDNEERATTTTPPPPPPPEEFAGSTLASSSSMTITDARTHATTDATTTTTTPEGFAASSLSSLSSSSSLVDANVVVVDRTSENNGSSLSSSFLVDANAVVVDRISENNGSTLSSLLLVDANAVVVDRTSENGDSDGRFSSNSINKLRVIVDPVNRGDGLSPKTSTMHHTVAAAAVSGVLLETLSVDGGGGFSRSGTDGGDVFAQRKLVKSSKKVKHPKALCTLSLFADSLFLYANQCFTDIMVTISPCDDKDDMCYISERLPLLPQEEQEEQEENQEGEQCFVGGSFLAKQNIRYNPSTGDCEFLYVDLVDDPCNLYTGDTGKGSLGLKARINVQNHPDVMFIQFTKDKGLTFYNVGDERVAKRSKTHNDRYLRQEGATKPALSMMPHPFPSRQLLYSAVSIKNDTPHKVHFARVEYCACTSDQNNFIASGGTWTVDGNRGGCLVQAIHITLLPKENNGKDVLECASYLSDGTGIASFYIMLHNGECCLRSWKQSNTECTRQSNDIQYCNPSVKKYASANFCGRKGTNKKPCANDVWKDGCEACMCFNYGNRAWCDGYRGDYYDTYFEEHGENPWGDNNVRNRKCNEEFLPKEAECERHWQCTLGLNCQTQTTNLSVTNDAYYRTCQSGYPDRSELNVN